MQKLWTKLKHWWIGIWHQLDNWQTLVLFGLVCAIIYAPVWGGYLLYYLFHWKWALIMATAVLAFWAGPFTPFFPICVAITLAIKRLWYQLIHKDTRQIDKAREENRTQLHPTKKQDN